jgi:hypothetical protein
MARFSVGDKVVDRDGDVGTVLIPEPDICGDIVILLTKKKSKYGYVGSYYTPRESELHLKGK